MPRDILNDLIAVRTSYTRACKRGDAREKVRQRANREKRDRKEEDKEKREREGGGRRGEKITAYPLFVGATRRINVADVAVVTGLVSLKDNT